MNFSLNIYFAMRSHRGPWERETILLKNNFDKNVMMTLKQRFLSAVILGELGCVDDVGVVVTLKEFKACFPDVTSDYINSFLPASTIEPGQLSMSRTKFLFRIRKGVYRVHTDALELVAEQALE